MSLETDDRNWGPSPSGSKTCVHLGFTQSWDHLTAVGVSYEMDLDLDQMLVDRCSQTDTKNSIKIGTN